MSNNVIKVDNKHTDTFELAGQVFKIQILGAQTGNQFSQVEIIAFPGTSSPLHRHNLADQAVFVLEGELQIVTDSETFSFVKGETGLIRRGTPHIETNRTHSETRFITVHAPGDFSKFVRLAANPFPASAKVPPPASPLTTEEARKIVELGLEFDTEILISVEKLVEASNMPGTSSQKSS